MDKILKVEDSNSQCVPKHLELLMERMGKEKLLYKIKPEEEGYVPVECELIFAVSVVVALEEGFRIDESSDTIGFDKRVFESLIRLPNYRTKTGILSVELRLPMADDYRFYFSTDSILKQCTLLTIISENKKGKCVSSSASIQHDKYLRTSGKGAELFQNIYELCSIIKKPIYNAKQNSLRNLNVVSPDLLGLPEEIKRFLFKKLKYNEFVALCLTCTKMCQYINDETIWMHFLKRDFNTEAVINKTAKMTYQIKINHRLPAKTSTSASVSPRSHVIFDGQYISSEISLAVYPPSEQYS